MFFISVLISSHPLLQRQASSDCLPHWWRDTDRLHDFLDVWQSVWNNNDPKSGILADFLWNPRVSIYSMESDNCAARREIPGMVHGTQDYVCRRQKYFITVSANGTYRRRGKRTNHQDVFCTRHLIGTICIVGIISSLCREKTEIWKSSVICLKTQKVIISRSILFPWYLPVEAWVRMHRAQTRILGRGDRASQAGVCQITCGLKSSFPKAVFTTADNPTFLSLICFLSVINTVLSKW